VVRRGGGEGRGGESRRGAPGGRRFPVTRRGYPLGSRARAALLGTLPPQCPKCEGSPPALPPWPSPPAPPSRIAIGPLQVLFTTLHRRALPPSVSCHQIIHAIMRCPEPFPHTLPALSGHCGARALRKFGLLLETLSPPTWPGTSCSHAATTIVDDAAAREPAALSFLLQSEKYIRQRTILSMYDADAYLPVPICISLLYSDLMVMLYINHQHQTPS
jgi:hypothetical protein